MENNRVIPSLLTFTQFKAAVSPESVKPDYDYEGQYAAFIWLCGSFGIKGDGYKVMQELVFDRMFEALTEMIGEDIEDAGQSNKTF